MSLLELYPQIRHAHIGLVLASGSLFALRGAALLAGAAWPLRPGARIASVAIDSALLTAGVLLLVALQLNPFGVAWLQLKLAALVLYVVLGTVALKGPRSRPARIAAYAAALLCFVMMIGIARAHHPGGWFVLSA